MNGYQVRSILRSDCEYFILHKHYAKRWPSISHAFGLFLDNNLIGVVTYGTPPSPPLRRGIAGDAFKSFVLELNRLVLLNNRHNEASLLVGRSLKLIGGNKIIISFADTDQNHVGYVYQACNFTYHGLSAKRTDWKIKGMEGLHGVTIADQFRGIKNRSQAVRAKYGDNFYLAPRSRKHRYIYIIGSKKFKKDAQKHIKYPTKPYPKEEVCQKHK